MSESMRVARLERAVLKSKYGAKSINAEMSRVQARYGITNKVLAMRAAVCLAAMDLLKYHGSVAEDVEEDLMQFRRWE